VDKRAARNEYKTRKTPKGIFAVRCKATGDAWVGASTHLDSQVNGLWFVLRGGLHQNKPMQALWNAHGEGSFTYEIVEVLDDDVPPLLLKDLLQERQRHWRGALGANQTDPLRG
jgi:hypothetical protein